LLGTVRGAIEPHQARPFVLALRLSGIQQTPLFSVEARLHIPFQAIPAKLIGSPNEKKDLSPLVHFVECGGLAAGRKCMCRTNAAAAVWLSMTLAR